MSTSSAHSGSTLDSSLKKRKKRTIVVVRQAQDARHDSHDREDDSDPVNGADESMSTKIKKKTVLVSRQPRPSESRLFEVNTGPCLPPVLSKLRRDKDGQLLDTSILGSVEVFQEMKARLSRTGAYLEENDSQGQESGSVRSLNAQGSKRSLRSSNSGGPPSLRDRSLRSSSAGAHGSRAGAALSHETYSDAAAQQYFRRIAEAEETAATNRAKCVRKEAKMMEHVGLTERLTMQKEGNALRQWDRRQRDWHRVSEGIVAKTGKAPESLVMSTADDYRERSEEYQLIQNAIPTFDKYSSDGWVRARDIGDGNMFSGLNCIIENRTPPTRAVRKPTGRLADATRKRTWRSSQALELRRKQLASALKKLRPQDFRPEDTSGLLVQGEDLLQWAKASSLEYFELRHAQAAEAEEREFTAVEGANMDGDAKSTGGTQAAGTTLSAGAGPILETRGTLLPGETTTISFSFKSVDPGVFGDHWRLETVPKAATTILKPRTMLGAGLSSTLPQSRSAVVEEVAGVDGAAQRVPRGSALTRSSNQDDDKCEEECLRQRAALGKGEPVPAAVVEVGLRGVALCPDTREHARRRLVHGIGRGIFAAKAEEIVREVVRGVRTPIREEEIRRRQREAFLTRNAERGLYFTPLVYDGFASLMQRAKAMSLAAQQRSGHPAAGDHIVEKLEMATSHDMRRGFSSSSDLAGTLAQSDNDEVFTFNCMKDAELPDGDDSVSTRPATDRSTHGDVSNRSRYESLKDDAFVDVPRKEHADRQQINQDAVNASPDARQGRRMRRVHEDAFSRVQSCEAGATVKAVPSTEKVVPSHKEREVLELDKLRCMLKALNDEEWDGAAQTVRDAIEGLSQWMPPAIEEGESVAEEVGSTGAQDMYQSKSEGRLESEKSEREERGEGVEGGGAGSDMNDDQEEGKAGQDDDDETSTDADRDEAEEEDEAEGEDEAEEEREEEEEEEEGHTHPLLREQRALRAEWRRLFLEAQLEPATHCTRFMRKELGEAVEKIAAALDGVRSEARGATSGGGTPRGVVLRYNEDSRKAWAAACPAESNALDGPRARAAAALKAGNNAGSFLALAYAEVATLVAEAAENFEQHLLSHQSASRLKTAAARSLDVLGVRGGAKDDASSRDASGVFSRLAALTREDIAGRRLLLHVDLSKVPEREHDIKADSGGDGASKSRQQFSDTVKSVAEQVRGILSAKAAAVAILSEGAPPVYDRDHQPHPPDGAISAAGDCVNLQLPSLRVVAASMSSLLGMEVEFYDTVPDLAEALSQCRDQGSRAHDRLDADVLPPFGGRVMMAERLSAPGVVPTPPREEPELSDSEEERLPDFGWAAEETEDTDDQGKERATAEESPREGDIGAMLDGVVDVTVLDAPRSMYEPARELPWGPSPTTGLTVAGTGLHGDLTAMAYLTQSPERPLLAIVGGDRLEPRLKLIDGLLDFVDTLAIGGGLSATLFASMYCDDHAKGHRRQRRAGPAGKARDPPDVFTAARRLLVKARQRGVQVILPLDFVMGDIEVNEHGPIPGPDANKDSKSQQGGGNIVDERDCRETEDDGDTDKQMDAGEASKGIVGVASAGHDVDQDMTDVPAEDVDTEDPTVGFEYEGETIDVSLQDRIPRHFSAMDIGPQTVDTFKQAVRGARAILWHGVLGVAECAAFQSGTREVLEAVTSAHDDEDAQEAGISPVVVLCGRSLERWSNLFMEAEEDAPSLGSGYGVSHVCNDPGFCTRVLEGRLIPGLSQLSERDPPPSDANPAQVLRRCALAEGDEPEDSGGTESESSDD